jgi:hypothetical protein
MGLGRSKRNHEIVRSRYAIDWYGRGEEQRVFWGRYPGQGQR